MVNPRLTVVMPMKGRNLFTFRFLWHANNLNLPYHILIADGQVNEAVANRLENSASEFPNLTVRYMRYPNDLDFSYYFAKLADAVGHVQTPYVMLADNDDFLGFGGIEASLDFLDANPDYVCARARTIAFSLYAGYGAPRGGITGRIDRFYLHNDFKSVTDRCAADRIKNGGLCHGYYYAVFRTPVADRLCREAAEINFSDLMLYEDFFALRAVTFGKAFTIADKVGYFSQAGTGVSYQPARDWARHLLRSRFTSDADALIERVSSAAAEADAADRHAVEESVRSILERYYAAFLAMNYGPRESLKRFVRRKWPQLIELVRARPRLLWGMTRSIFTELKNDGADEKSIADIKVELDLVRSATSEKALTEFAGSLLPMARADASRVWV